MRTSRFSDSQIIAILKQAENGIAQPCVAAFVVPVALLKIAALRTREAEAAKSQILAMMDKAPQVSALGKDDQANDRFYSWNSAQLQVVLVILEESMRDVLKDVSMLCQLLKSLQLHLERHNLHSISFNGKGDETLGHLV